VGFFRALQFLHTSQNQVEVVETHLARPDHLDMLQHPKFSVVTGQRERQRGCSIVTRKTLEREASRVSSIA